MIRYSFETVLTDLCPKILVAVILIISVILRWTVYGKKWSVCTPHHVLFSRLSVRPLRYNAHQTKKPTLGSLPPSSLYLRQPRRNADLHVGAGWDRLERGFGISRASMSHPLPLSRVTTTELAHWCQPGQTATKVVPEKCQQTPEKELTREVFL